MKLENKDYRKLWNRFKRKLRKINREEGASADHWPMMVIVREMLKMQKEMSRAKK